MRQYYWLFLPAVLHARNVSDIKPCTLISVLYCCMDGSRTGSHLREKPDPDPASEKKPDLDPILNGNSLDFFPKVNIIDT